MPTSSGITRLSIILGVVAVSGTASAAPGRGPGTSTVTGEVIASTGRFTADGRTIVTDAVIRTDDGRDVTVLQLGGRADGLGQLSYPSPPRLEDGTRVRVAVRVGTDRRARAHLVVEDVALERSNRLPFVRTGPTEGGHFLSWASGCVFLHYQVDGTADLSGTAEFTVLDQTLAAWNSATDACSYLVLTSAGTADVEVGHDRMNIVLFRDDLWCRPATEDMPEVCLASGAAGLTTVTYIDDDSSSRDGEIVDADVELNAEEFAISANGSTQGEPDCLSDLANVFTHELGHVMGLDHTCLVAADDPKVDGNGDPVPLCTQTSEPGIVEATMYNFQDCGETKKSSPEPDDVAAVCRVYSRSDDPGTCTPVGENGGCCSASGDDAPPVGATLLTLLLVAAACRRRTAG